VISAPIIKAGIRSRGVIVGFNSTAQAQAVAIALNSRPLPAGISVVQSDPPVTAGSGRPLSAPAVTGPRSQRGQVRSTAAEVGSQVINEFSADFAEKGWNDAGAESAETGRAYVAQLKTRFERTRDGRTTIDITRLDKRVTWTLNPARKTYSETPIDANDIVVRLHEDPTTLRGAEGIAAVKRVGSEVVNGYDCDKYALHFRDKTAGTQYVWFAKKLRFMLKLEWKTARISEFIEYTNIREGPLPDSLFEIPAGYKKTTLEGQHAPPVERADCQSNARQLVLACLMFAQDHAKRLPNAATWMDDIRVYLKSENLLRCPEDKHRYSYAMNAGMSGRDLSKLDDPDNTVILYELSSDQRNASGTPPSPSLPGLVPGGRVYAYATGRVRFVPARSPS
jgi:hypothetical protein